MKMSQHSISIKSLEICHDLMFAFALLIFPRFVYLIFRRRVARKSSPIFFRCFLSFLFLYFSPLPGYFSFLLLLSFMSRFYLLCLHEISCYFICVCVKGINFFSFFTLFSFPFILEFLY